MADEFKWKLIDKIEIQNRHHLEKDDICYYLMEHDSKGYKSSKANQLIFNLKIPIENINKNPNQEPHKKKAMLEFQNSLLNLLNDFKDKKLILIPAATSKPKNSEFFDKRLDVIVENLCKQNSTHWHYEPILDVKEQKTATHSGGNRSIDEIKNNLIIKDFSVPNYSDAIIILIIDDVLTTGSHFRVWKNEIMQKYPLAKNIQGAFLGLHIFDNDA